MRFNSEQLAAYRENGILLLPEYLTPSEILYLKEQVPVVVAEDSIRRVREEQGDAIRSVYGSHMTNEAFRRLTRHPRIVEPARQVLGSDVYVYQFKINIKAAFSGDVWDWHQDYMWDPLESTCRHASLSIL